MSAKDSAESTESTENIESTLSGGGRAGVLIAAVLLLACVGLVGYGLLDDTED
jgi:hypothetical protein